MRELFYEGVENIAGDYVYCWEIIIFICCKKFILNNELDYPILQTAFFDSEFEDMIIHDYYYQFLFVIKNVFNKNKLHATFFVEKELIEHSDHDEIFNHISHFTSQ